MVYGDTMMNHLFPNKEDGRNYVRQDREFARGNAIGPLGSDLSELDGWYIEMYCSKAYNEVAGEDVSTDRDLWTELEFISQVLPILEESIWSHRCHGTKTEFFGAF
jgi:hypothetical protein